jgi:predicted nucleic acid-binding protein
MRAVLDTNIFLVSISRKSSYHWIFREFMAGRYTLCVSNEIVFEYEEIIAQHMGRKFRRQIKISYWNHLTLK